MMNGILTSIWTLVLRVFLKPLFNAYRLPRRLQRALIELLSLTNLRSRKVNKERVQIAGIDVELLTPKQNPSDELAVLYIHGGAFVLCSPATHRSFTSYLAVESGAKVFVPDYSLAPEVKFPQAIDECLAVYQAMLEQGYKAENIVVSGDSAGGNLCLSAMLKARDQRLPLPKKMVLFSPWVDLLNTDKENVSDRIDCVLSWKGLVNNARLYIGDASPDDPLVSPLFADYTDFMPTHIFVGTQEILLPQAKRLADQLISQGVKTELNIIDKMWHVFHIYPIVAEFKQTVKSTAVLVQEK